MNANLSAANEFMATHARVLDRRRFELRIGLTDPSAALGALDGYRNVDGGYGWGLEPDLRTPESQPGAARHAFEVFEDIAPAVAPQAATLCDWLDSLQPPRRRAPPAPASRRPTRPWPRPPGSSGPRTTACARSRASTSHRSRMCWPSR